MNSKLKIALAAVVGVALGAAGMQGLQAQAKPKAYQVTELDVIDAAALKVFGPLVTNAQKTAGGRNLRTVNGKVVALGATRRSTSPLPSGIAWTRRWHFSMGKPRRTFRRSVTRQSK